MGIFSRFERGMEDHLEGAAGKIFNAPITPVQISKKAERAMHREKMVGAGKQYAPTLYTVLVNPQDDARLFGYYPTLAGETETYLSAKAAEEGFLMDGQPLVRFIVNNDLRKGRFEVVAELVSAPIIAQLRSEEMRRYGLATSGSQHAQVATQQSMREQAQAVQEAQAYRYDQESKYGTHQPAVVPVEQAAPDVVEPEPTPSVANAPEGKEPLPYVPEEEIDRSIDYGEYTFNSQDWDSYQKHGASSMPIPEGSEAQSATDAENAIIDSDDDASISPDVDLSGLDVAAYDVAEMDSRDFDEPNVIGDGISAPDTSVFAGGPGNDAVIPDAGAVRARLVNTAGTRSIDLAAMRLILGRSSSCDIMVDDINASRNHAELRCDSEGTWQVNDLGSTNGTLVNGRRITSHILSEGDRIRIGTTDFVFTQK